MLRRQALGTINLNQNANNASNQNLKNVQFKVKTSASCNAIPSTSVFQLNDENEPPQIFVKQQQQDQLAKACCDEVKFEIFQEEQQQFVLKNSDSYQQLKISNDKIVLGSTNSNKENYLFKSEEDEDDYESEGSYESESEEEESESDEEKSEEQADERDDLEEEEEGISRLNLLSAQSDNENLIMMDSSVASSSHFTASPMVLDDTIKFMSKLEDSKCENENYDFFDDEEEQCVEAKKKLEAENVLFNMIDYKDEILKYMRKLEQELRPKANYMKKQMDISSSMRAILIDWLVEVCEEYRLNIETLYLAVNYIDRFLSQMSVLRSKLQLVGTASMYIASKYEEITPPDVNEFVYITDDTYTKKQVLRMEHLLLKVLDFRVSQPTVNWFLTNYLKFIKLNTNLASSNNSDLFQRIEFLARYLCELTLLDCDTFLCYLPSQIAASSIYLALLTFNKPWTKQIADLVGYSHDLSELKPCINEMYKLYQQASELPQQAIQEKYKQAKYEHVSMIDAPKALPSFLQTNTSIQNSA